MLILRPILNRAVWNFSGHSEESRYPQPIGGPADRWASGPVGQGIGGRAPLALPLMSITLSTITPITARQFQKKRFDVFSFGTGSLFFSALIGL